MSLHRPTPPTDPDQATLVSFVNLLMNPYDSASRLARTTPLKRLHNIAAGPLCRDNCGDTAKELRAFVVKTALEVHGDSRISSESVTARLAAYMQQIGIVRVQPPRPTPTNSGGRAPRDAARNLAASLGRHDGGRRESVGIVTGK